MVLVPVYKALQMPVLGQGVFYYQTSGYTTIKFMVSSESNPDILPTEYAFLKIESTKATCGYRLNGDTNDTIEVTVTSTDEPNIGTEPDVLLAYWLSYDRDACMLKYGKGYTMEETTMLTYDGLEGYTTEAEIEARRKVLEPFFNAYTKKYVTVLGEAATTMSTNLSINIEPSIYFTPNPFVCNQSPLVKDSATVNLFDLDQNLYTFSSDLPQACQVLYGNIKNLELEDPPNPMMKLSDAIRYSINTPGCLLYEKIKEKAGEFGPSSPTNMTYLRVTLGPDVRSAPGVPYVLEIWPSGCMSPIHSHSNACAIIKVLFGAINISIYNKLTSPPKTEPEVLQTYDATAGNITWLSPFWFQVHKLQNNTTDFCATIQCYRYDDRDTMRYPGFDFITPTTEDSSSLDEFLPNSDFTFLYMREKVFREYYEYLAGITAPTAGSKKK